MHFRSLRRGKTNVPQQKISDCLRNGGQVDDSDDAGLAVASDVADLLNMSA